MSFEWHPAALFRRTPEGKPSPLSKFALIILNQPLTRNAPLDILWENGMYWRTISRRGETILC